MTNKHDLVRLVTVPEVCEYLGISRTTLYRLEKQGKLKGRIKVSGQVRYDRELLKQSIKESGS